MNIRICFHQKNEVEKAKRFSRNSLLQTEESSEDLVAAVWEIFTFSTSQSTDIRKFMKQNVNKKRKIRIALIGSK